MSLAQSKSHKEARKLIFDKSKLDKLGQIYELDVDVKVIQAGTHGTLPSVIPGVTDYFVHEGNGDSKAKTYENSTKNEVIREKLITHTSIGTVAQPNNASQASQASPGEETKLNPVIMATCPTCPYTTDTYTMKFHQCEGSGEKV